MELDNQWENSFVKDLIQNSVLDEIWSDEIPQYIEKDILEDDSKVQDVYDDSDGFLQHSQDSRCLFWVATEDYWWQEL